MGIVTFSLGAIIRAAAPGVIELPDIGDKNSTGGHYVVVVYNNDINTWDEVVNILMQATGCPMDEAEMETWEVDNLGKSVVHHGDQDECESVAAVIRQIGIRVEVIEE